MTPAAFRKTALSFPETAEASHMGHPDFRVRGKIFATLGPDEDWGMVKLTPEQQAPLIQDQPAIFQPASGAWGRRGCTIIQLKRADKLPWRDFFHKGFFAITAVTGPGINRRDGPN